MRVIEGEPAIGGGTRTEELTLPGHLHDVCSAVHPLAARLAVPRVAPAGRARPRGDPPRRSARAPARRRPGRRAAPVGRRDGRRPRRRRRLPTSGCWARSSATGRSSPASCSARRSARPGTAARRPVRRARPALRVGPRPRRFADEPARALLAGNAAHSMRPLTAPGTAAFALLLVMLAHAVGWPVAAGGSQRDRGCDGVATCARWAARSRPAAPWRRCGSCPPPRAVLLDVTPRALLRIAGERFPGRYRRALERFRYGPGVFKVDYALREPVPWAAAECRRAGTVHVGGTAARAGRVRGRRRRRPRRRAAPTCSSPSRASSTRPGRRRARTRCGPTATSRTAPTADMTDAIERQIERFAPGFRDVVAAAPHDRPGADRGRRTPTTSAATSTAALADLRQLLARPALRRRAVRHPGPAASSCARPRRRPAAACTACAAGTPLVPRSAACCADARG